MNRATPSRLAVALYRTLFGEQVARGPACGGKRGPHRQQHNALERRDVWVSRDDTFTRFPPEFCVCSALPVYGVLRFIVLVNMMYIQIVEDVDVEIESKS